MTARTDIIRMLADAQHSSDLYALAHDALAAADAEIEELNEKLTRALAAEQRRWGDIEFERAQHAKGARPPPRSPQGQSATAPRSHQQGNQGRRASN